MKLENLTTIDQLTEFLSNGQPGYTRIAMMPKRVGQAKKRLPHQL